jgi:hypothetical protein
MPAVSYCLLALAAGLPYLYSLWTDHKENTVKVKVKVKVTLRPTTSRSVSPGFKSHVGLTTGYLFLLTFTSIVLSIACAPSDERSGLSFVIHRLRFLHCCMTSLPERTPNKTTVFPIVSLPIDGCKQRFHCWLLTYSVHVTILLFNILILHFSI